jgi:hypothetical protein
MRSARNDRQLIHAAQGLLRSAVEIEHDPIILADDEQRRSRDRVEPVRRKVRTASAG